VSSFGVKPSLRLDFHYQQKSYFLSSVEKSLQHNYEIPPSVLLHFPNDSTRMIDGPGDICVNECMFWGGVGLPFPPIIREMLSFFRVAPG
jgi:hypothetical protein